MSEDPGLSHHAGVEVTGCPAADEGMVGRIDEVRPGFERLDLDTTGHESSPSARLRSWFSRNRCEVPAITIRGTSVCMMMLFAGFTGIIYLLDQGGYQPSRVSVVPAIK